MERKTLNNEKKKYKCHICGNSYSQSFILSQHIRKHNNITPFKCTFCSYAAVIKSQLTKHLRIHGIFDKQFPCRYCDLTFNFPLKRREHEMVHTGQKYLCKICGKDFSRICSLTYHSRIHPENHKFFCPKCNKGFVLKCLYEKHVKESHLEFGCKFCCRTFSKFEERLLHENQHKNLKTKLSLDLNFEKTCILCKAHIKNEAELKAHVLHDHANLLDPNSFGTEGNCGLCGKNVKAKKARFYHLLNHLGIKAYKCHICKYATNWYKGIKSHLKTHTDIIERFKCENCEQKFFKRKRYLQHCVSEHGLTKSFLCEICGKAFFFADSLKMHKSKSHKDVNESKNHFVLRGSTNRAFCKVCNMIFDCELTMEIHEKLHALSDLVCEECNCTFSSEKELNKHYEKHPSMLECIECDAVFDTYLLKKQHKKLCSMKKLCSLCDLILPKGDFLSLHIKREHIEMCFQCDICQHVFAHQKMFIKHLVSHFSELKEIDSTKSTVYEPTFDSEDEEMFEIENPYADIRFSNYSEIGHKIFYECNLCGANFVILSDLLNHESQQCCYYPTTVEKNIELNNIQLKNVKNVLNKTKNIKILVHNTQNLNFEEVNIVHNMQKLNAEVNKPLKEHSSITEEVIITSQEQLFTSMQKSNLSSNYVDSVFQWNDPQLVHKSKSSIPSSCRTDSPSELPELSSIGIDFIEELDGENSVEVCNIILSDKQPPVVTSTLHKPKSVTLTELRNTINPKSLTVQHIKCSERSAVTLKKLPKKQKDSLLLLKEDNAVITHLCAKKDNIANRCSLVAKEDQEVNRTIENYAPRNSCNAESTAKISLLTASDKTFLNREHLDLSNPTSNINDPKATYDAGKEIYISSQRRNHLMESNDSGKINTSSKVINGTVNCHLLFPNESHKKYFKNKMGVRIIKEKIVYKDGKKRIVTEDCGFIEDTLYKG